MEDLERRIKQPFCYVCLTTKDISIKKTHRTWIQYICKQCRNAQHKAYMKSLEYHMPAKKTKEIGWTEAWLQKAKESEERISRKGLNYGA